jgi:hypothetical protein
MKSISFTEKELDFLLMQYQVELEEAEEYVENIKSILEKVEKSTQVNSTSEIEQTPKKRGRKPKVKTEPQAKEKKKRGRKPSIKKAEPIVKEEEKARKPRSNKGRKRIGNIKQNIPGKKKPIKPPTESETDKIFEASKKKIKRKKPYKRHGVRLAPLAKPVILKEEVEVPILTPEVQPFVVESVQ